MISVALAVVLGFVGTFLAFARLRGATALAWSFVVGFLLLPSASGLNFQGLPWLDKYRMIWLGGTLGTLLFHTTAVTRMRWHVADLLLLGATICRSVSSITNDLGAWDALSSFASIVLSTVLPYWLARVHFTRWTDLVALMTALFWGAVLYVPLALWEFRMSPQLHNTLYGYFPHDWRQQMRWGFYRPVVFLGHGLGVAGLFSGCLVWGILLYRRRALRWSLPFPVWFAVAAVGVGLLVGMSFGPWFAVPAAGAVFWLSKRWRWAPVAVGLPGVLWVATIFTSGSNWSWMTQPIKDIGAERRALSMQYRLDAMADHAVKIQERPWFGHGGFGRGRIKKRATDSVALVYLLANGFVGAGMRYAWIFCVVIAAQTAAWQATGRTERDVLLLLACLMGISVSSSIFGTGGTYVPFELVGGAMTGLAAARVRRPRGASRVSPVPVSVGTQQSRQAQFEVRSPV